MQNTKLQVKEIVCSSALNKMKGRFPYAWDLNIYRGCQHGCRYCFAMYTHKYLDDADYFQSIYVKQNIVEVLERELKSNSWKREIVNIGGVTDSYQPIEAERQFMPDILKLFIKYKTPVIISTKSDLILRDYNLIDELSRITYVNIAATITAMDEEIRKKIEPFGCESEKRFEMLKIFRKTNASIGLHTMPIIPYLTDSYENFNAICSHGQQAGIHYMLPGTLYLRGQTRKLFFDFIKQEFPNLFEELSTLYKKGGAGKEYKDQLYKMLNTLRNTYGLSGNYTKPIKEKMHKSCADGQLEIPL